MRYSPKGINFAKWFAILPKIIELIDDAIQALKDGKVDEAERKELVDQLFGILSSVL